MFGVSAVGSRWLVGGTSILGLQLIRQLGQPPECPSEGTRDPVCDVQGRVARPAFDAADSRLVKPGAVREHLLREPELTTTQADRPTEGDLWCWALAHPKTVGYAAPSA